MIVLRVLRESLCTLAYVHSCATRTKMSDPISARRK